MLQNGDLSKTQEIISYSIPNFFEAILGTSLLVLILLTLKFNNVKFLREANDANLKLLGIGLSTTYVITQELKFHNLGGNNIYDFNDLIASIIGLVFISFIILKYGIARFNTNQSTRN